MGEFHPHCFGAYDLEVVVVFFFSLDIFYFLGRAHENKFFPSEVNE